MSTEEEDLALWQQSFPDRKLPGTRTPENNKCGARVRNKDLHEVGLERFCGRPSGWGTLHAGEGRCKLHGGSTASQTRGAVKEMVKRETMTLAEQLGEPIILDDPEIEFMRLTGKMKRWSEVLEGEMAKLNGQLVNMDDHGVEQARAVIELLERGWDRLQKALEFQIKVGLKERVIALEEKQGRLVGEAFFSIIMNPNIGLKEAQIDELRKLFSAEMNRLAPSLRPSWSKGLLDDDDEIVEAEILD